nr:40S ribosomal protein S13 [Cryptomonas paramecium]
MAKMHGKTKGTSSSILPFDRKLPQWYQNTQENLTYLICKLAKKGLVPSQIGIFLRDCKGIPQVKYLTGKKILRILKINGLSPEIPEDLFFLIKKATNIKKHLEKNKRDKDSKFRLILVESKIYRLSRYYKTNKQLPTEWKYENLTYVEN